MFCRIFLLQMSALAVILAAFCGGGVYASVVFDNTTTQLTGDWGTTTYGFLSFNNFSLNGSGDPTGNQITLAGTDRDVKEFDLMLSSTQATILSSLTLTFYQNNGTGYSGTPNAPGTVIGTPVTLNNVSVNGLTSVHFSMDVVVPDTFIWVASASSDVAGPALFDPATLGTSGVTDDSKNLCYWDFDQSDTGQWMALNLGNDPVADLGARVIATPEPLSLTLLALGALGIMRRRRT
jgi:hypothetical protein